MIFLLLKGEFSGAMLVFRRVVSGSISTPNKNKQTSQRCCWKKLAAPARSREAAKPQVSRGFATSKLHLFWLVVEPIHLENGSQIGEFPQGSGWKQKIVESTG